MNRTLFTVSLLIIQINIYKLLIFLTNNNLIFVLNLVKALFLKCYSNKALIFQWIILGSVTERRFLGTKKKVYKILER